jgi:hypothetical protein
LTAGELFGPVLQPVAQAYQPGQLPAMRFASRQIVRIAPKVLLPGRGFKAGRNDTLRQK